MLKKLLFASALTAVLFSCKKNDEEDNSSSYEVPSTYEFTNDEGESTVSFSGQVDRRNQLAEIKSYMSQKHEDVNADVTALDLNRMYSNDGATSDSPQKSLFSFESTKQLESKTATADAVKAVKAWFDDFENSDSLVERSNGSSIIVNEKGHEHVQLVEKGLMGAVFFNQAVDNYLDIDNLLADDNETLVEGKTYTERELHFDEGFGYFGAGIDYPAEGAVSEYHAEYAKSRGLETVMMEAFLHGRAAIVNKDDQGLRDQVAIIRKNWEAIIGQQAAKYIGDAISNYAYDTTPGDFCYPLSEAYAFIWSLKYKSDAKLTTSEIDSFLTTLSDFSTVKKQELATIKAKLEVTYGSK